jgi:hypothetical protein
MMSAARADEMAYASASNPVVKINIIGFDPASGQLSGRLELKLPKSEVDQESFSPHFNYVLVDKLNVSNSLLKIKSSEPFSYFNNDLDTLYQVDDAGNQFMYPFDHHKTRMKVFVKRQVPGEPSKFSDVPVTVDTSLCSFTGYDITLMKEKDFRPEYIDYLLDVSRNKPIKIFSVFISFLMLLVAWGYGWMALKICKSKAPPDINEMVFGGALLFSLPAIRNIQPLIPPMGVLTDYCGFFIAETVTFLALIVQIYLWISRKKHHQEP